MEEAALGPGPAPGPGPAHSLQTLEQAAHLLLAPPNLVTAKQRREAEETFLAFRNLKSPYVICKEILETSAVEYVLFEAVVLLKEALLKEWSNLAKDDIVSLRRYLINYIMHRELPSFVREKIMQLMSMIVKRLALIDNGVECCQLIEEGKSLVSSGPGSRSSLLGCSILLSLIQEHSITVKSSDSSLPWIDHLKLKKRFEVVELKNIFIFNIKALQELETSGAINEPGGLVLAENLLLLAEMSLCWGRIFPYLLRRFISLYEVINESNSPMDLHRSKLWKPILTDETLPTLFGHYASRGEKLQRPALVCLEQIASLYGGALPVECKKDHTLRIAKTLLPLLERIPTPAPASALNTLVVASSTFILAWPENDLNHFLQVTVNYIMKLVELTRLEDAGAINEDGSESMCRVGLEAALSAWLKLLHTVIPPNTQSQTEQALPPNLIAGSAHIFDILLKARLSPPDGTRCAGVENDAEVEEEGTDLEKYESFLIIVGAIGRAAPGHVLPLLSKLLESRLTKLQSFMMSGRENQELTVLYEDLHWILLFSGHVLTMGTDNDGDGETPSLPSELVRYSITTNSNVEASLRLMNSIDSVPSNEDLENADPIIRLVAGIWMTCWWCGWKANTWLVSPVLGADCAWLVRRWARVQRGLQGEPAEDSHRWSLSLQAASSDAYIWARLAAGARALLYALPGDPSVSHRAVALLITVASNKNGNDNQWSQLWEVVQWGLSGNGQALAGDVRRSMARAGAIACAAVGPIGQNNRLATVLAPVNSILSQSDSSPELVVALDVYAGLADGVRSNSAEAIWNHVKPALLMCTHICGIPANREGGSLMAALRMASACGKIMSVLRPSLLNEPLLIIADLFRRYATLPLPPGVIDKAEVEDAFCEELKLLMDTASGISMASCLIELEDESVGTTASQAAAQAIIPRMAPPSQFLKHPALGQQYYKLLPEFGYQVICRLEPKYFDAVIASISSGLQSGPMYCGVSSMCDLISDLASHVKEQDIRTLRKLESITSELIYLTRAGYFHDSLRMVANTVYTILRYFPRFKSHISQDFSARLFDGTRADSNAFAEDFEKLLTT